MFRPLLINGRKFGIRLWVLVPGALPLRVYLHTNGLALFSDTTYEPAGVCCGTHTCVCVCIQGFVHTSTGLCACV